MTRHQRVKMLLRAAWVMAIVIVIVGSLLPATSIPIEALGTLGINDKVEHLLAYAVLAFLPALHERWRFVLAAAVGAAALGVALEFGQLYSGWRDFEIGDMVADTAGVCCGVAAAALLRPTAVVRSVLGMKFAGSPPGD
ncbi:MAG TPA: VanZ family protein [Bryobacteraceae bacterium]|nr:VanZ family protein [Bryobacteraceae bacterium]